LIAIILFSPFTLFQPSQASAQPIQPVQKFISTQAIKEACGPQETPQPVKTVTPKKADCPIQPDFSSAEVTEPAPAPVPVVQPTAPQPAPQPTLIDKGTFKLTFYDPAVLGATDMPGGMYSGVAAHLGVIPRGSKIKITLSTGEVWYRTVNDTGSFAASNSQQLDVAMASSDIPSAGVLTADVQIIAS